MGMSHPGCGFRLQASLRCYEVDSNKTIFRICIVRQNSRPVVLKGVVEVVAQRKTQT